jgi:hypothetical protein
MSDKGGISYGGGGHSVDLGVVQQGVRRIVTGNTKAGRSTIVHDDVIAGGELWVTTREQLLGAFGPDEMTTLLPTTAPDLDPPPGGSVYRVATMPPWPVMKGILEGQGIPGLDGQGFHRTLTIDYVTFIGGDVQLLLDEAETVVRPGDIVIQRNTLHAWKSLADGPITLLGFMVRV